MEFTFNSIIKGNSDELLPVLKERGYSFDLILTDPPYKLNKDFGNDSDKLPLNEFLDVTDMRIELCKNLLKPSGSILWFGIHDYIGYIQKIMYDHGLFYRRMNIWFYENGFSRNTKSPLAQYEPFLWFSKNKTKWTYNTDEVRVPYKSTERLKSPVYYNNSKGEKQVWRPNPLGAMRGDIWSFPTLAGKAYKNEKTPHPTQKPESLITELIKAYCPINSKGKYEGTILDPFHGSGTLGVCCEKLNLMGHNIQWLGIELEKKWVDVSNDRLLQIKNQSY